MKITAAALLLLTVPTLAGAAALQDSATASMTTHTKHYVLKETGSHRVGKYDFVGTDKVRAAGTRDVVGFDSYTGHFFPKKNVAVIQAGFSLKGGVIVAKVRFVGDNTEFKGRILHGTGVYHGIEGTVTGRDGAHGRTFLTLEYTL